MSALDLTVPPAYVEPEQVRRVPLEFAEPPPKRSSLGREFSPDSGWTKADTGLEALFAASLLADYLQTRKIVKDGRESNPIMGKKGQNVPPELYFPAAMLLHAGASRLLPNPYRKIFQGVSLIGQGATVGDNLSAGYGFSF